MRSLAHAAFAASLLLACRSAPERTQPQPVATVTAADLGRLAPEQMGPVQTARGALDAAADAVARGRLRLQDSQHEEGFARADRTQADADRQRAEAELRAAQETGDARLVARASELREAAALRTQAADARLDYARRLVAARARPALGRPRRTALARAISPIVDERSGAARRGDAGQGSVRPAGGSRMGFPRPSR